MSKREEKVTSKLLVPEIKNQVDEILRKASSIQFVLDGHSEIPDSLYDKVLDLSDDLLGMSDRLVTLVEETYKNMEVGAIEPVDKYFEGNPVSDYVNTTLDFLQGNIDKETAVERLKDLATKIEKNREKKGEEEEKGEKKELTPQEYLVECIIKDLAFGKDKEGEKEEFKKALLNAVNRLEDTCGCSEFYVSVNGDNVFGFIDATGNNVIVKINGKEYKLYEQVTPVLAEDEDENEDECYWDCDYYCACDCDCDCDYDCENNDNYKPSTPTWTWVKFADDDKGTNMSDDPTGKKYMGIAHGKTDNPKDYSWSLMYSYVEEFEKDVKESAMDIMDLIKKHLESKTTFNKADIKLIRFFLRNLPQNSDYDIEELSDHAVELAWKQYKYRTA